MLRHPCLIPLSHQHQHALALCVTIDRALRAQPAQAPDAGQASLGGQVPSASQAPQADRAPQLAQAPPASQFPSEDRAALAGRVPGATHAPTAGQAPTVGLSPEQTAGLARKAADLFEIEIRNHFDVEERILFPAIREHLGAVPLVDELIGEHRRLEALIARLPATLAEFAATLSAHIRKEERDLFEDIQKRLPAETLEQLKEKIAAEVVRVCL